MEDLALRVKLKTTQPVAEKMRRFSPQVTEAMKKQLLEEIALGLYEKSQSPWAANLTPAMKSDKTVRICIDLRRVNNVTIRDRYPLPRMEDIILNIKGKRFKSLVDLTKGFNNLFIHPDDRDYFAFLSPVGLLRPVRLPFGWANGPGCCQREVDITLDSLMAVFRGYVDDISGGTENNQRLHDLILATVLYNFQKRGFRFHANKAQLLPDWIKLVGWDVNEYGSRPHPAEGLFDVLLKRDHSRLRDVQRTIGTLQWFQTYIPNFSYRVRHITQLLRTENRGRIREGFTQDCVEAIKEVKRIIEEIPVHTHPDPDKAKEIFIAHGNIAFAAAIYQLGKGTKREIVQFWSRRWTNDVVNYNTAERLALAVREIVVHFRSTLEGSPSITIYSEDQGFIKLANDPAGWNTRMFRYLSQAMYLNPKYRIVPQKYRKDLDLLSDPIPKEEISPAAVNYKEIPVKEFFGIQSDKELHQIPLVHTDGGCITDESQRIGAVGVYWGPNSSWNLSQLSSIKPHSNQRSELEAILLALQQAHSRNMIRLILLSDSAYAINCITEYRTGWDRSTEANGKNLQLYDRKGDRVKNDDLFIKIFNQIDPPSSLRVYFSHIRRAENDEADRLVNDAFRIHGFKLAHRCDTTVTRSQHDAEDQKKKDRREQIQEQWDKLPAWKLLGPDDDSGDEFTIDPYEYEDDDSQNIQRDEYSPLAEQLNVVPPAEVEDVTSDESDDELFGDNGELPEWTEDVIFDKPDEAAKAKVPILRLEAPQIEHLIRIMTLLPQAQLDDEFLGRIIQYKKNNVATTSDPGMDREVRRCLLDDKSKLLLVENHDKRVRIFVPTVYQAPIIELFHRSPILGGHAGYKSTLTHIQRYFLWNNMHKQIQTYCASCEICMKARNQSGKIPGFLTHLAWPQGPMVRMHADTLVRFKEYNGYQSILVVVDAFTKYIFTHPVRKANQRSVIEAFTAIFTRFGQPAMLIADNGREFRNRSVVAFLRMWGVQWKFTAPYNPQANGQAEAAVKIISNRLRLAMIEEQEKNTKVPWTILLPYVTMSYNQLPNESTGFSPYELMFGRTPPLPYSDRQLDISDETLQQLNCPDYLKEIKLALKEAQDLVNEKTRKKRESMQRNYNRCRKRLEIQVGDLVYITKPYSQILKKTETRAKGPYKVVKVSHHPTTHEVVGVEVDVTKPGAEKPDIRFYPRRRLRVLKVRIPETDWDGMQRPSASSNDGTAASEGDSSSQTDATTLRYVDEKVEVEMPDTLLVSEFGADLPQVPEAIFMASSAVDGSDDEE